MRESGFYWVLLDGEWVVGQKRDGYWADGYWAIVGTTMPFRESEFQKIGHRINMDMEC